MLFSSLVFLTIFLPIVLTCHWLLPSTKSKNYLLLVSSFLFYAWGEPVYIINILLTITITYISAILIDNLNNPESILDNKNQNKKLLLLSLSIAIILALLFYYKYFNFVINNFNYLLEHLNLNFRLSSHTVTMPIGISFYSFQAISYLIDVYRNQVPSQKNFSYLALYISLFPQLIAGPIVRYKDIFKEITHRTVSLTNTYNGSIRFIQGLAKKVLIANTLGEVADHVFGLPSTDYDFITCWLGALCYSLQLYFDFSGYSDMAIGLGRMFGFKFLENFNYPYISKSITEFWRRWHISLSSWFRDYVYISLGGNRVAHQYNLVRNIFIVFLLTGIWHGANWTFIIWGLWHGFFVISEKLAADNLHHNFFAKTPNFLKHIYTMLIVIIGWIIFRAESLNQAVIFIKYLFIFDPATIVNISSVLNRFQIIMLILGSAISLNLLVYIERIAKLIKNKLSAKINQNLMIAMNKDNLNTNHTFNNNINGSQLVFNKYKLLIINTYYLAILLLCMIFLIANTFNPFIYFRF